MSVPVLATKLYIPSPRPELVHRPRLIERLNNFLNRKLILISAPAGFGKTTLLSEWITDCMRPTAWVSLDRGDNDPVRFLTYLIVSLQTISPDIGGAAGLLQSPQPPPTELILTVILNEISAIQENFLLILDDYHSVDSRSVNDILSFLIEHKPPKMHMIISTREDPDIPIARLRASGQLGEIRAVDLRFAKEEVTGFLTR